MTDEQFEEMMDVLRDQSDYLERICNRLDDLSPEDYSSELTSINRQLSNIDSTLTSIDTNTSQIESNTNR